MAPAGDTTFLVEPAAKHGARRAVPTGFWLANYCLLALQTFAQAFTTDPAALALYSSLLAATYAGMYLLPAWAVAALIGKAGAARAAVLTAVASCTIVQLAVLFDLKLYGLYGYHFNGFIWNLLTTPGGLASLGASRSTYITVAVICAAGIALQILLMAGARRLPARLPRQGWIIAVSVLVCASVSERVWHGIADHFNNHGVLITANLLPAYQSLTFSRWLERLGYPAAHKTRIKQAGTSPLRYPLQPLTGVAPDSPPNIILLVAESWRADTVDPHIMPATSAFATRATRFNRHYSGGNGTRMGLFSLFYGLYGAYWHDMLTAQRPPLLMDRIQALDYQILAQTSAHFSYPEFDRTLFAGLPAQSLHEDDDDRYWQRDRRNVSRGIDWMRQQSAEQPFFYFQFFESPHARYYFPEESIIEPDFEQDLNYMEIEPGMDLTRIHNRYINSVHHLDQQLERIFVYLENSGHLNDTIVILTGDHGEEFNENGHWGHNSQFTEWQIRVPFIIFEPGRKPDTVDRMTSHLDLAPTLLARLGVNNDPADYSNGTSLFTGSRSDTVVADWSRIGLITDHHKLVYALDSTTRINEPVTTAADQPVDAPDTVQAAYAQRIGRLLEELSRFRRPSE